MSSEHCAAWGVGEAAAESLPDSRSPQQPLSVGFVLPGNGSDINRHGKIGKVSRRRPQC